MWKSNADTGSQFVWRNYTAIQYRAGFPFLRKELVPMLYYNNWAPLPNTSKNIFIANYHHQFFKWAHLTDCGDRWDHIRDYSHFTGMGWSVVCHYLFTVLFKCFMMHKYWYHGRLLFRDCNQLIIWLLFNSPLANWCNFVSGGS